MILKWFKNWRSKKKDLNIMCGVSYQEEEFNLCNGCRFNGLCQIDGIFKHDLESALGGKEFNPNKKSILLIDDNQAITGFLREDLEYLNSNDVFNIEDYNIITVSGPHAAYNLHCLQEQNEGLNIEVAIIDTSYIGAIIQNVQAGRFNGVDVYETISKYNPDVKVLFHSNCLNVSLKSTIKMLDHFFMLTGKKMENHLLVKTMFNIRKRRAIISEKLFGRDLERAS